MGERLPINGTVRRVVASMLGKTGAGKRAAFLNRPEGAELWPPVDELPPLVEPPPLVDQALTQPATGYVWAGAGGDRYMPRHAFEPSFLENLGPHEYLYVQPPTHAAAAAALMFGGPGERCLSTTTTRAGDVEHTHVCIRRPHGIGDEHCSHTGYIWGRRDDQTA